jgi:formylglycine-generating enzyme required for sulfatase activity/energy-coupling factor transporter ATP-binding protein EcfA2
MNKSVGVLLTGLGVVGAAYCVAPAAAAAAAGTLLGVIEEDDIKKFAGGLFGHIGGGLCERWADWFEESSDARDAKNHDLRKLLVQSISYVLDKVINAKPPAALKVVSVKDYKSKLEHYKVNVVRRLQQVMADERYDAIGEQSVVDFFKPRVQEFASVRALTPELWKAFLEDDYDVEKTAVKLNRDQLAALEAAAQALYRTLARQLVSTYRIAFKSEPEIYVAVQTAMLQDIMHVLGGVEKNQRKLKAITVRFHKQFAAFARKNQDRMQRIAQAQTAMGEEFRAFVLKFEAESGVQLEFLHAILAKATKIELTTDRTEAKVDRADSKLDKLDAKVDKLDAKVDRYAHGGSRRQGVSVESLTPQTFQQYVTQYLDWLRLRNRSIPLYGVHPATSLAVGSVYVPLRAKAQPERTSEPMEKAQAGHLRLVKAEADAENDISMNSVLAQGNRLAIVGGPGSGKTTVLKHMAWLLARAYLENKPQLAEKALGYKGELLVPVFCSFSLFARYWRDPKVPLAERTLESFLVADLEHHRAKFTLPVAFFKRLLSEGRGVILLMDGLDEVADEGERRAMRKVVGDFVQQREALRVLVSCRTVTYQKDAGLENFREIAVQSLDKGHVADLLDKSFKCRYDDDKARAESESKELQAAIERLEENRRKSPAHDGRALVDSPLMVHLMFIVKLNNKTLPEQRAALFEAALDALFNATYSVEDDTSEFTGDAQEHRDMAMHLAFWMHGKGNDNGREIDGPDAVQALAGAQLSRPQIDLFIKHARGRGGVFEEVGGIYRFMHLSFQEYLVARYLRDVMLPDLTKGMQGILHTIERRLTETWWREPILLLAGSWAQDSERTARAFIHELAKLGKDANQRFAAADLAATATLENRIKDTEFRDARARQVADLLSDEENLKTAHPVIRARAALAMSHLGDPRFHGPELFYLPKDKDETNITLGFENIPADEHFIIGTRPGDRQRMVQALNADDKWVEREINDTDTPVPHFYYMARYPVTVAQFKTFVRDKKYVRIKESELPGAPSQPVTRVDWHTAMDYCDWLNERLIATGDYKKLFKNNKICEFIETKKACFTLPSELEWEKAARGGTYTVFPWGDTADANRANYGDSGISDTSVAGCFQANAYRLQDMIGNVWEWTRSRFEKYPYDPADGRENRDGTSDRVVRGGSWYYRAANARCASRSRFHPDLRNYFIGFRLVLRSPLL